MQLSLSASVSPAAQRARCSGSTARLAAAPQRFGRARAQSVRVRAGLVQQLTAEELEVAIADRDKPLVIDFFASWCGPCVLLAAELEKVAEELGDTVRIVKVDTESEPELSSQLQIQGLPTIVFVPVSREKAALRAEGLLPASTIKKIIADECV